MVIYQATGDLRKVTLWLGHANMQTTEIYLQADPTEKIEAIESVVPHHFAVVSSRHLIGLSTIP